MTRSRVRAASSPAARQSPRAQGRPVLIADDGQRLLFRVILEDAIEWHLAAIGDCAECEWMIELGICARHQAEHAQPYASYLACAAYFESSMAYRRAQITAVQMQLITEAIPKAVRYRSGLAPADAALSAAYAELARQIRGDLA